MSKETFTPENKTISEIFNCDRIYRIPDYQRQYSWTNEELDDLWNDLYEAYLGKNECFFLGSIVVVNNNNYDDLIDGQQRITTLMIMMDVLIKDFKNINQKSKEINYVNLTKLKNSFFHNEDLSRLQLQSSGKCHTIFKNNITNRKTYKDLIEPTKKEIKSNDVKYKYLNTAYFFYQKFKDLASIELNKFVNYIFFKTSIIKIVCHNVTFAIKLFQILNNRGLDLTNADLVKAEIFSKYKNHETEEKNAFNQNWNDIVALGNSQGFTMDDFMVIYEYYKLRENPRKQVFESIKEVIKKMKGEEVIEEMVALKDALNEVYTSQNPIIYSLFYIPWKNYVMSALATTYMVNYPHKEELFKVMRRFYYLAFIAGGTINTVKTKSFNLIKNIYEKKDINYIKADLEELIINKKMIKSVYEALQGNVYDEKFLKPLLLSIEYMERESSNTTFYEIDRKLHIDHILPKAYKKNKEWDYIKNRESTDAYLNTLGNMALLSYSKNEECENFGFSTKIRIYQGLDENGQNQDGITTFETTRIIIDDAKKEALARGNKNKYMWTLDNIEKRYKYLKGLIEKLLDIKEEDVSIASDNVAWKYNNETFTTRELIKRTFIDYINLNNFNSFQDIPREFSQVMMNKQKFLKKSLSQKDIDLGLDYEEIEVGNLKFYLRTWSDYDDLKNYLKVLEQFCYIDITSINDNKKKITKNEINMLCDLAMKVNEKKMSYQEALKKLEGLMNLSSAKIYIDVFGKMLEGKLYKRAISAEAANIYIEKIRQSYGIKYSTLALNALKENINYLCNGNKLKRNQQLWRVYQEQSAKNN